MQNLDVSCTRDPDALELHYEKTLSLSVRASRKWTRPLSMRSCNPAAQSHSAQFQTSSHQCLAGSVTNPNSDCQGSFRTLATYTVPLPPPRSLTVSARYEPAEGLRRGPRALLFLPPTIPLEHLIFSFSSTHLHVWWSRVCGSHPGCHSCSPTHTPAAEGPRFRQLRSRCDLD